MADRHKARERLDALYRTRTYWFNEISGDSKAPAELLTLLRERAWPSDHIQWALVEPVRIYCEILESFIDGADKQTIGHLFNSKLESWVPEIPISEIWASLPVNDVMRELEFCENALLQTHNNKQRFRQYLAERFKDITSIQAVLNGKAQITGAVL